MVEQNDHRTTRKENEQPQLDRLQRVQVVSTLRVWIVVYFQKIRR